MVLREAFEKGYDYWAISEIIIQEAWPLLNYLLILETVRRLQDHLKTRYTIGYYIIKDTLRRLNKHLDDNDDKKEDEIRVFFRYYANALYRLRPSIRERDPYDITDEIFDESRERFWSHLKLYDLCEIYQYPTYFAIDRDIVHTAAFRLAEELSLPLEPQTTADIMHDLWDEARFKLSRSLRTEDLLEKLILIGADGMRDFLATVAEEQVYGYSYVTANRYDGYNIVDGFGKMLQSYSTTFTSKMPGSLGHHFNGLHQYFLQQKRYEFFEQFAVMDERAQEENMREVQEMLYRMIEVRLRPSQAPDFKRRVELAGSARVLIDAGQGLVEKPEPNEENEHLCGLLAMLDRHPMYHTRFLEQYRELSGQEDVVIKKHLAPVVERLAEYLPENARAYSSDPSGFSTRHHHFIELREYDPDSPELLALLAALFIRLDASENYPELLDQVRALGEYARPALDEIAQNPELFGDQQRGAIGDACRKILKGL
ncbi:MAG: hypothetical protein ACI906_002191 [Candidatus Latescibacterota bacterium]|jgi:hypothetical protein